MTKTWKQISGHPNYEINRNTGEVASLNFNKTGKRKILSTWLLKGYRVVKLGDSNKRFFVHRLMYCSFNNVPLDNELLVCHKNDDKADNRLSNLYMGTHNENMRDKVLNSKQTKGESFKQSKLTERCVILIRNLYKSGLYTHNALAEKFSVSQSCITFVLNRVSWKHVA